MVPESIQQYYPVTAMSFWIDHQLWGAWTLPGHLENVLLHGGSVVLFWMLLKHLQIRGAWLAAAFFALHPVMVESVAWMTERKNVLCTLFALLALLCHGTGAGWWEPPWKNKVVKAGAIVSLAGALQELGYNAQAIEWLDRAIALHPEKCAVAHYNKAIVFEAMNRATNAEASFKAAISQKRRFLRRSQRSGKLAHHHRQAR